MVDQVAPLLVRDAAIEPSEQTGGIVEPPSGTPLPIHADDLNAILRRTVDVFTAESQRQLKSAAGLLAQYANLPSEFDILALLSLQCNEAAFCRLLCWLLDPAGSHGIRDAFLRLFLARLGISCDGRVFNHSETLQAEVLSEVSWEVPEKCEFGNLTNADGDTGSRRSLRVDILIFMSGHILPIEAKVYAKESQYFFEEKTWNQAALYGRMWQLMMDDLQRGECKSKTSTTFRPWNKSLSAILDKNERLSRKRYYIAGGRAQIIPVLIHPRSLCHNISQRIGRRANEHGIKVRHVRWLDIDKMLHQVCKERELPPGGLS